MNLTTVSSASDGFEFGNDLFGCLTHEAGSSDGLAICSNCRQVVPMGEEDGSAASDSVLLAVPCPRCGEAAMRASDGTWD